MEFYYEKLTSSARLSNARRPKELTLDEQERQSLDKLQNYLDAPVNEDGFVNKSTKDHRAWLMRVWKQ